MKQKVVAIDRSRPERTKSKTVPANQKAVNVLRLDTGTWSIQGIPGLYVRCRKASKSYLIQRRIANRIVKKTIGEVSLKVAKREGMRLWATMRPAPSGAQTLEGAFAEYLDLKDLSPKTRTLYEYNLEHYLAQWKRRTLHDIGNDRSGVRRLFQTVTKVHGKASASQTIRMLAAVYRFARRVDISLPECPTTAVDLPATKSRDWALSPAELCHWWAAVQKLTTVKRAWWTTALLTGARRGSVEALRWNDIDSDKRLIHFSVAKGGRTYTVPAADRVIELLENYRDSGEVPPSEWVFPSTLKPGGHIVGVRDDKHGVKSAHHLRHTYRTVLAELGATPDQARLLMGHSMGGDVSRGYITAPLVIESLRPLANAVAGRYETILGELVLPEGS